MKVVVLKSAARCSYVNNMDDLDQKLSEFLDALSNLKAALLDLDMAVDALKSLDSQAKA